MENIRSVLIQLHMEDYIPNFERNDLDYVSFLELEQEELMTIFDGKIGPAKKLKRYLDPLRSGQVYKCFVCPEGFNSPACLILHLKSLHNLDDYSNYQCVHCPPPGFFSKKSFLRHLREIFKRHNNFLCSSTESKGCNSTTARISIERENFWPLAFTEPLMYDISEGSEVCGLDKLYEAGAVFKASVLGSGKVPLSVADSIFKAAKNLFLVHKEVMHSELVELTNESTAIIDQLSNPFLPLETRYKLDKYLINKGKLVPSRRIVIDSDFVSTQSGQNYKQISFEYVSLRETLSMLFRQQNFFELLSFSTETSPYISHYRDGFVAKSVFELTEDKVLFLNIFYDDMEPGNVLGSKSGFHKLSQFYFNILNMPPNFLSSPLNWYLLASIESDDLKVSPANTIVTHIVEELLELWVNGMTVTVDGKSELIRVCLGQIQGDNLGVHGILGFSEGFTANYPCRKCKMKREDCRQSVSESKDFLRTRASYEVDVGIGKLSETGIKFGSEFNRLPYLHVTQIWTFDIQHDILEGVAHDVIKLIIENCISQGVLTIQTLNLRLQSFKYGRHYSSSKPTPIKDDFAKDSKLHQNSSQTLCFLLCLPLIIGDLVPRHDETWALFLIFREMVDLIMAPAITKAGVRYLKLVIQQFLTDYKRISGQHLKPKFHHLTHYPSAILNVGPLRYCWAMAGESKHKFFKNVAHVCCNFKNIAYTGAYRHQLSLSFRLLSNGFSNKPFYNKCDELSFATYKFSELITFSDIPKPFNLLKLTKDVELNGCNYRIGTIVLLSDAFPLKFGEICSIIVSDDDVYVVVEKLGSKFCEHFHAHSVVHTERNILLNLKEIAHFLPLYTMKSHADNADYVVIPFRSF